jgi:hypothetical protein
MQKTFNHYYKQNEMCLKLVLLPFTLTFFVIKKLVQATTKCFVNKKH